MGKGNEQPLFGLLQVWVYISADAVNQNAQPRVNGSWRTIPMVACFDAD